MANEQNKKEAKSRRAGQIVPRGEDKWLVRIYVGRGADGKRRYHNHMVNGKKKDAQTWLNGALRRLDLGEPIELSDMQFDDFLDQWLELAVKPRVRARSFDDYQFIIERHVKPVLGKKRLRDLKAFDLQSLYAAMEKKGLSAKTIRNLHVLLNNALKQAVAWEKIRTNPAATVEAPKVQRKEMKAMSPEQARAFLKAAESDRFGVLFAFALATGARPEEYCALKWSDVDWQARAITIQRAVVWRYKPARWYFDEPKTASSRRTLPIGAGLLKQLAAHKKRQAEERLLAGPDWKHNDLVFANSDGQPLYSRLLKCHFDPLLVQAEIFEHFRIYDLRHSCATLLMLDGLHPKVVSERLGHANISMTLQVYSHVLPRMQEKATESIENTLFGTVGTL